MALNVMISAKSLYGGINQFTSRDECVNAIDELSIVLDHCDAEVWCSSHTHSKALRMLRLDDQKERFRGSILSQNATQGANGFNDLNSTHECAKNLSYKSTTLILLMDDEKDPSQCNVKMIELSPGELLKAIDLAVKVAKIGGFENFETYLVNSARNISKLSFP